MVREQFLFQKKYCEQVNRQKKSVSAFKGRRTKYIYYRFVSYFCRGKANNLERKLSLLYITLNHL